MVKTKKEKAIEQALANLRIDRIYVSDSYVQSYKGKHNIPTTGEKKLVLRRSDKNNGNI